MRPAARAISLGVVGHTGYAGLGAALQTLHRLAPALNFRLRLEPDLATPHGAEPLESPDQIDALLTLGGDGTLLRGARMLNGHEVPILGVNMGRLGFLTCCPADQLETSLMRFARGDYTVENRMMLRACVAGPDRRERDSWLALNDVVIHVGGFARVIPLKVSADDELIASYSADGVVIATPTGSTAYSLSAGGPVMVPTLETLIVTAVSPHTLAIRPVVLSASARITVHADGMADGLMVTVDGQVGTTFRAGESLIATRAEKGVKIVRFPGTTFFTTLREKLGWGGIPERDQTRHADRTAN
ncbi:MAG TPA: NAD(+)/NADH kinase [Gemmatimonadaceae bacterium]|nr:NAD(+)/NADH kinase [Gemmatimonadaceae bacterium]